MAVKSAAILGDTMKKLEHEKEILSQLRGTPGVPKVIWFGVDSEKFVLVMELLGSDIGSLIDYCGGRLSIKTALNLADKLLCILESTHKQGAHPNSAGWTR